MSRTNYMEKRKGEQGIFRSFLLFTFCFLLSFTTLIAQPKDNAPYSIIGLGEQVNHTLSSAGFGGLTAAYYDPFHVNWHNPASLGWLGAATFEVGMYAERSTIETSEQSSEVVTGNLSHLMLAFPVRNSLNDVLDNRIRKFYWGMNLAVVPNTNVGYDIQTEESNMVSDSILNIFQGSGGTNKLIWGNGVRYKNFSAGINLQYIFGQLESTREVRIRDIGNAFYNQFVDNISVRGLQFSFGLQYKLELDKKLDENGQTISDKSLVFGMYGNPRSSFSTRTTALRIGINDNLLPNVRDTLLNELDIDQDGKLPSEWTFGIMYQQSNRLRAGVEFSFANWSKYENEAKPDQLFNSNKFAVGLEYSPDATSYNNYLKRIRYRTGFYFSDDPRLEDLKQYAFTFGLGLPLILPRGKTSFVSLGFELGRFQTDNGIDEKFMKMSLGFTLNDGTWFYKRKFG